MNFKGFYTGVGSRETPEHICRLMKDIAAVAAIRGYTGRSGGADKADDAFETGFLAVADSLAVDNMAEFDVYLPWKRFNGRFAPKHIFHDINLFGSRVMNVFRLRMNQLCEKFGIPTVPIAIQHRQN